MPSIFLKIKKNSILLCHIIVGVLVGVCVFSLFEPDSFNIWKAFERLLAIGVFYIHALVLIPFLLKSKAVNKYVLHAFGLFAIGAVGTVICRIASQSDYIYTFTKILYYGPAFGTSIEGLYKQNFFFFLLLYTVSFGYGLYVSKTTDSFKYFGTLIFGKKYTELLIHIILLLVISITSYFAGMFFSNNMIGCLLLFYFHLLFVAPILVKENKTNKFFGALLLEILLFNGLIIFFTNTTAALVISLSLSILTIATIYAIVKHQFRENEFLYSKKEVELQQLKSKVNPHFLFNSLNALYSFALKENAEKTAQNIKKLSNLIRFMLNDIEKDYIPIQNEVNYIKDYIDIQLTRCSSKQNIKIHVENIDGYKIAPMLLIPFVENSFKHGINPSEESTLILNLECKANLIKFECRNSLMEQSQGNTTEQGLGIGIENIKSRLALIYPDKHIIVISKNTNEFSVKLEIYDNSNCN